MKNVVIALVLVVVTVIVMVTVMGIDMVMRLWL